jgi:small subunit ribosomal protein S6
MTLLNVDAPPAALNEIARQERLNEDVLRYLTIRVEAHEDGPSAMMRKSDRDRDERGDRGDRGRGERRPRRDDADDEIEPAAIAAVEE